MIIKTIAPHANARGLGRYVTKDSKDNELIEERETRGTVAMDTRGALLEMAASRHGSRCQKPLYHVVFNAAKNEHLSPMQWERAYSLWEQEMGLVNHQRTVVQHLKDGRWHSHVIYNRIDLTNGKAVNIGHDHFKAKRVARQIELELGLQRVPNQRAEPRREHQPPHRWETEQTRRTKANANEVRDRISEAWSLSDTGRTFQHALEAQGLTLAKGDRRPFVVLDKNGNFFALSGRLLSHTRMKDIRAKLADVNYYQLPTVATVRQQHKQTEFEKQRRSTEPELHSQKNDTNLHAERSASSIHDKHRAQHVELNQRARAINHAHANASAVLEKTHERERELLREKQRDRWWHKLISKSKKTRDQERLDRARLETQQAREKSELEERKLKELAALDAQRKELRKAEREEARLARDFSKQASRAPRTEAPIPNRETDLVNQRFNATTNRKLALNASRTHGRKNELENDR